MNIEQALWLAPVPILGITAILTWMLSNRVGTRRLGFGVVVALGLACISLLIARTTQSDMLDISGRTWLAAYSNMRDPVAVARFSIHIDGLNFGLAITILIGAILCILTIAQSLGASLRGYGRLWSNLLLMLIGVLITLAANDLVLFAFGWGLTLLGTALARRVVGGDDQRTPVVISVGMLSLLALIAGIQGLVVRQGDPVSGSYAFSDVSVSITFLPWLALCLAAAMAMGVPPFGRGISSDEGTPPLVHGSLLALGMPTLGIYLLLRLLALSLGRWPQNWFTILTVVGVMTLFIGAAAALRCTRFGPLIGNQMIAQWGIILIVLGRFNSERALDDPANSILIVVVISLILSVIWSTILSTMALGVVERRTGSDFIANQPFLEQAFRAAGWAYGFAAATAVGLPPLIGYVARRWFFNQPETTVIMPALLSGSVLLAASYLGPMALFWRVNPVKMPGLQIPMSGREHDPVLLAATLPLLGWALAPNVLHTFLTFPALRAIRPLGNVEQGLIQAGLWPSIVAGLIFAGAIWAAWGARNGKKWPTWQGGEDTDLHQGIPLIPQALGHAVHWLAVISNPSWLFKQLGRGIERISTGIAWAEQVVTGRYYLTGILIAALTLMLLLVQ